MKPRAVSMKGGVDTGGVVSHQRQGNKMHKIYKAVLCVGLPIILSACATKSAVDESPTANNLVVGFSKYKYGAGGSECAVYVPDNGTAPVCKEALDNMEGITSLILHQWQGARIVCFRTAQDRDAFCLQEFFQITA